MRKLLPVVLGFVATFAAGCGTSTLSLVLVRPAVVSARPFGDTLTVAGFRAMRPELVFAAEALRQDVLQEARGGVGGVVRVIDAGGGLVASGELVRYDVVATERTRASTCPQQVTTIKNNARVTETQQVPCTFYAYDWRASVQANLRVTSAQGQVLYYRGHTAERSGSTNETQGRPLMSPNRNSLASVLSELRATVADEMGAVLVPHRVRVSAAFFDCAKPAEATCAAGMQAMMNNHYDGAAQAFTDAHAQLVQAHADNNEVAKALWNRALVYKYSRQFDKALLDLRESCRIESRMACNGEMQDVEAERALHQKLVDEGLGH
jgi:hypothetical protein